MYVTPHYNNSKKENTMAYFNPEKLKVGTKDVEAIFEASDSLGLDIIRVVSVKAGAHVSGIGGFDIPRTIMQGNGIGASHVLTHGIVYLFPDKNLQKHGFVLATDKNKRTLATTLSANIITILNKKDRDEIIELAKELGKPTERAGYTPSHIADTNAMKTNQKVVDTKSKKLEDAESALEAEKAKTAQLMLDLENSKRTIAARELSVKANEESVEKAEAKLELSRANAVQDATILDVVEKSLDDDGEVKTEVKTLPKPKRVVKRQVVKK
jgi:hypothetical protein